MHLGGDYRVFAGALLVGVVRHENSHEFFTATPKSEPLLGSRKTRARAVSLRRANFRNAGLVLTSAAIKTPPGRQAGPTVRESPRIVSGVVVVWVRRRGGRPRR